MDLADTYRNEWSDMLTNAENVNTEFLQNGEVVRTAMTEFYACSEGTFNAEKQDQVLEIFKKYYLVTDTQNRMPMNKLVSCFLAFTRLQPKSRSNTSSAPASFFIKNLVRPEVGRGKGANQTFLVQFNPIVQAIATEEDKRLLFSIRGPEISITKKDFSKSFDEYMHGRYAAWGVSEFPKNGLKNQENVLQLFDTMSQLLDKLTQMDNLLSQVDSRLTSLEFKVLTSEVPPMNFDFEMIDLKDFL